MGVAAGSGVGAGVAVGRGVEVARSVGAGELVVGAAVADSAVGSEEVGDAGGGLEPAQPTIRVRTRNRTTTNSLENKIKHPLIWSRLRPPKGETSLRTGKARIL